ncbi:peroxiredoxin, partial [Thermodesulfobacteriota bacterium]
DPIQYFANVALHYSLAIICWIAIITAVVFGCAGRAVKPVIETTSATPGGTITRGGTPMHLIGTPLTIGGALPSAVLVDTQSMKDVDLSKESGRVLLLSIVPSLDTKVCDLQTHYLGEAGAALPDKIQRITISRDTPFAQQRFARKAKLKNIRYLSDYKRADFGHSTGLLIDELMLLGRSVVVVDKAGMVRYIQVVPELSHLPDMEQAFKIALKLNGTT